MYDIAQQLMYVIVAIIVVIACRFLINYFLPNGNSSNNLFSYPQTHSRKIQNLTSGEKRIVNENLEELVNIMATVPSAIINHLHVKGIFNDDQRKDLNQISNSKSQALQIIAILKVQDQGMTGIKEALHVCRSSSVYNRMFGELEINHFSTPPPVSHMRSRMRFLFNRVIRGIMRMFQRHIDTQHPEEWCALARSVPSRSIHICQNYFSEPTSKAEIDNIVICNIDLDTANNLRSWINCNSISSLRYFVINALHVQDSEDGFKSLQSVLEVMVKVTKVTSLYIFLPLHCVSQRLSSHNANINFVQCVQSIQSQFKRVIINGSQSTSTTVVYQDIQKWLFASSLYLVELKIKPGDVITVIKNIAELNETKGLIITRNDLSSDDYENICLKCEHIQMGNSGIGLVVQPKTDLTNTCVEHLIGLMIQLINYEMNKVLSIRFVGVNNLVKSEHLLEYLFNRVKDIIEVNEIYVIWIQLDDCGLDKKHCDIIHNLISQFKHLPSQLHLSLELNEFTVKNGNDLERKLKDLFKDKSVTFYQ